MRKVVLFLALAVVLPAMAQDVKKMSSSGQSGPSEKARYVLGLVRNGYADKLNNYFDKEPWQIQTEIDTYTDAAQTASVGIFCVAVDLGNLEVVKSFVEHGIGPQDLCRVQTFSTKKVIVSRAERLINTDVANTQTNTTTSDSSSRSGSSWFGGLLHRNSRSSSYSTTTTHTDTTTTHTTDKYTKIHYGEKKVVKTYFANPLDFATEEVFDYLWTKGFRSNNLFTKQALAEAKANGRTEIVKYILDNKPQMLGDKPVCISQETYDKLLETAKKDPHSLAYTLLEKKVLGIATTSAQAQAVKQTLAQEMQTSLAAGRDTTGYAQVTKEIETFQNDQAAREADAKKKAAAAAAEKKAAAARISAAKSRILSVVKGRKTVDRREAESIIYSLAGAEPDASGGTMYIYANSNGEIIIICNWTSGWASFRYSTKRGKISKVPSGSVLVSTITID